MRSRKKVSRTIAKQLGDALGVDWGTLDVEEFRLGIESEAEQGVWDAETHNDFDEALASGKIVLSRLNNIPDYYSHLKAMEKDADAYWANI